MTTETPAATAGELETTPSAPKPAWSAPAITLIEIKRTGNSVGSFNDGPSSSPG